MRDVFDRCRLEPRDSSRASVLATGSTTKTIEALALVFGVAVSTCVAGLRAATESGGDEEREDEEKHSMRKRAVLL
jgi:hypothetical protein